MRIPQQKQVVEQFLLRAKPSESHRTPSGSVGLFPSAFNYADYDIMKLDCKTCIRMCEASAPRGTDCVETCAGLCVY